MILHSLLIIFLLGKLREMMQQWLTQNNDKGTSLGCFGTKDVLKSLVSFPVSFLKHKCSPIHSLSFDDEDVDAWKLEAQRWARVLFLVIEGAQHLDPIFVVWVFSIFNHCIRVVISFICRTIPLFYISYYHIFHINGETSQYSCLRSCCYVL